MEVSNLNYLYIEGDAVSREAMKTILEDMMGVRSLAMFENSRRFMLRLKALAARPDVILMDVYAQPLDGFILVKMLRASPDFRATRVIAVTPNATSNEVARLRTSGFDGAISKPISAETFPNLIERILGGESVWPES